MYKNDPDYNRIVNLYCITFLISRWTGNDVFQNDPKYIQEKWMRFIGFNSVRHFRPDEKMKSILGSYYNRWALVRNPYESSPIIPIICYLMSDHYLKFDEMIKYFNKYIGPFDRINPKPTIGLHPNNLNYVTKLLEENSNQIKTFLRPKLIDRINEGSL